MSKWAFHSPTRILFAENSVDLIGSLVDAENAVLITSPGFVRRGIVGRIQKSMKGRLSHVLDIVTPNPDVDDLDEARRTLSLNESDCIIALGGGSSIDTAKALSRAMASPSDTPLSDCFRRGLPSMDEAGVPIVAVPATAGTGSEVTPTATIWDRRERKKFSLSGDDLYPTLAILDPVITLGLPDNVTISSGLDAVSHAFESIWNRNASPISMALATQSLRLSLDALPKLKANPGDLPKRSSMMIASLMAGIAISQTRTAISHSISYPLTLDFDIPHGIAASFSLPEILRFNAAADDGRLRQLIADLGYATIPCLEAALCELLEILELPGRYLHQVHLDDNISDLEGRMLTKGRAENNLRSVELSDISSIFEAAVERYRIHEER